MWILALPILAATGHDYCRDYKTLVAREALSAYLDPSSENRAAATARVRESVILPLVRAAASESGGGNEFTFCVAELSRRIEMFASEEAFSTTITAARKLGAKASRTPILNGSGAPSRFELGALFESLDDVESRLRQRETAHARVAHPDRVSRETRDGCGSVADIDTGRCTASALQELALAGDPAAGALWKRAFDVRPGRDDDGWKLWLALVGAHPIRSSRLAAALEAGVMRSRDSSGEQLLSIATSELVGAVDPRSWDAADVALVVVTARAVDRGRLQPLVEEVTPNPGVTSGPRTPDPLHLKEVNLGDLIARTRYNQMTFFLAALKKMGVARAFALVEPRGVASVAILPRVDADVVVPDLQRWEHFPGEIELYREDWHATHEESVADRNLIRRRTENESTYLHARWLETDSKAPTPDLASVMKLIRKAEGTEMSEPK